jgi:quinol monooxygenase YgiN
MLPFLVDIPRAAYSPQKSADKLSETNLPQLHRTGETLHLKGEAMVKLGLLARLEAKPGKEEEVARFLTSALPLAEAEPGTTAWFAIQLGPYTFGIFDVFPDEAGRQAHLTGPIASALMAKASELLSQPPVIERVDVLASKLKS